MMGSSKSWCKEPKSKDLNYESLKLNPLKQSTTCRKTNSNILWLAVFRSKQTRMMLIPVSVNRTLLRLSYSSTLRLYLSLNGFFPHWYPLFTILDIIAWRLVSQWSLAGFALLHYPEMHMIITHWSARQTHMGSIWISDRLYFRTILKWPAYPPTMPNAEMIYIIEWSVLYLWLWGFGWITLWKQQVVCS